MIILFKKIIFYTKATNMQLQLHILGFILFIIIRQSYTTFREAPKYY